MNSTNYASGRLVVLLSIVWLFTGLLVFGCFAMLAFMLNPFTTNNLFEPEGYRTAVVLWHLPMVWGWVPAAVRSARGIPNPWKGARRTIVLGVFLGPLLFVICMIAIHVYRQVSASI